MQKASMRWIGVKLNISSWRHIAIAISRRYCQDPFQEDQELEEDSDDDPWDLQTGHSTHTAGMVYARELMEGSNAVVGRREKFRHVSQEWHKFWQFKSAGQEASMNGQKRKRVTLEGNTKDAQLARWKRLQTVDIREELKQMLGDEAEFRGLQKPALEAIMKNKSPILVVMGTGAGKSLLFQLPAHSQKSGTTVVIVPLKSLERSLHERCHKAGISCIQWDPQKRERMAQIVLVQPEAAVGKMFAQYLNKLQGLGQLDRIVIDECHTVLDSKPDFRPEMRKAGAVMMDRAVQMVYLTATLSPSKEAEFLDIMKVQIPDDCKFRGCTSRPNIVYSVVEYDEQTEAVCQLVAEKLEQYPSPAKIIVYSSSIETIKGLGSALNCHMYYADVGSDKEKDEIQQRWGRADGRVIVASNAFGLGIDEPNVRVVFHVGPIHQLENYGQESGRGGRDGKRSEAIILVKAGRQEALQRQPIRRGISTADKQLDREKVNQFISGERCRRIYLDQEMDGRVDRVRCEDGEERCDVCQKDDEAMEEVEALRQAYKGMHERAYEGMHEQEEYEGMHEQEQEEQEQEEREQEEREQEEYEQEQEQEEREQEEYEQEREQEEYEHDQMLDSGINIPSSFEMQDSTPSIELSDSGFSPSPGFAAEDHYEFQQQQVKREQQRQYIQRQNQQEGQEVWELEQQLEEWSGQCPLCFIKGHDSRHSIEDCIQNGSHEVRKGWKEMKRLMKEKRWFASFSCCFDCHVPQAICQKWVQKKEQGRWEQSGMSCQFDSIVMPTVIAAMLEGEDWMIEMIQSWVEESGVEFGDQEQMYKWYGQKVEWGGIEASRLIQVFYRIAKGIKAKK
jgi:superfamily II DNA helicase RecQ